MDSIRGYIEDITFHIFDSPIIQINYIKLSHHILLVVYVGMDTRYLCDYLSPILCFSNVKDKVLIMVYAIVQYNIVGTT